jgi:hypothetical protein
MSGFGRWLNQPQQGQQGGQLAALAQQLGIDPAIISAAGGQQSQSRLQQLAPLLGALGSGFNAIRAGGTFGQGFEPAAAQMQQGQQQQGGLQGLGQLLEIQQLIDGRKSADAERQAMADIQKRIDSGEKISEAEIVSLAMRFPKAQNVWQEMLKGLQGPEGIAAKDIDVSELRLRKNGVNVPGMEHISPEQAEVMYQQAMEDKRGVASAGAAHIYAPGEKSFSDKTGKDAASSLTTWRTDALALTELAANARDYAGTLGDLPPQIDKVTGVKEVIGALPIVNRIVDREELGQRQLARGLAGSISLAKAQSVKGALSNSDRDWLNSLGPQETWDAATRQQYADFTADLAAASNQAVSEVDAAIQSGAISPLQAGEAMRAKMQQLRIAERRGYISETNAASGVSAEVTEYATGKPEGFRFRDDETGAAYVIRNGKPVRE